MGRPADAAASELEQLDDEELLHEVRSCPPGSARRDEACEVLVGRYRGLVRSCANRYRRSPEPTEDLVQVGYVGLLKAINNFDPGVGRNLAAYAQPCITGEIKRYFRDKRWQVHIERPVQERLLELRESARQLTQSLGHAPSDAELAGNLGLTEAAVREAHGADMMLQPAFTRCAAVRPAGHGQPGRPARRGRPADGARPVHGGARGALG